VNYRIYAIRYGHREGGLRSDDFYRSSASDPHEGPHDLTYYVWAIVGEDRRAIVVDAGFTPETSARRPGRVVDCDPLEILQALGIDPRVQRDVVLTHLHYDHVGYYDAFPEARFWVHEREMAFWTGRYASRAGYRRLVEPEDIAGLVRLNFDGRLEYVGDSTTIVPGVSVHPVGGHSAGLQVVRVNTGNGVVVLASDAAHFYENLDSDEPFGVVHSLEAMYGAFDILRGLTDSPANIVPGHDPLVFERYPAVSPDLAGYAVELLPDTFPVGDTGS
jgi:glyoxylase-like metal-dependent hydrolase (beta-lactamase superfamily II)